ncbi:asparagine synthase (glutamine-hydrolyzing) [Thiomonas sp.]|jgi:asparagine synthase (glutamine-hydrolysing)|uniref:asparagine synthase (glutamine-hydrolyzing) n=1 Tax=Thiomonas sp. TaxID=2047785 RepID=UPI0026344982|nr:asparagine synthase (glutamine-hydrolyzing) [Thiomonas sp.]
MCGIAGRLDWTAPVERAQLQAMIARLRHRGPDAQGFYLQGPIGLAHARLSIIDLSGGSQPLCNEDGTVWVSFNGEIFNYRELRADLLRRGHRLATQSDTEVLVHLYEEHGDALVEHLNGQFAFALWDARAQRLLLARDRCGIRPLFHTRVRGGLAFASEVKALFALPDVPRQLDGRALGEVFTYWAPLPPHAVFAGIESLPPGHVLTVDARGTHLRRYWDWSFPPAPVEAGRSADSYAEELRALLIDAVRLQLRADVPVAAYLSGGLDSSIITTLIRHGTDTPLRTFSLTFDDAEFDESAWQQQLVQYLGTAHTTVHCTRADIAAAFPRTILHTEAPIVRTAPAPMMLLAAGVRAAGYKVALTGEGADEVFGGYDLFKEARVRRFIARQPQSRCRPRLLERLYPYLKHSPAAGRAMAERFFRAGEAQYGQPGFGHLPRWTTTRRISQFLSAPWRHAATAFEPSAALAEQLPAELARWEPLAQDQYIEAHTLMSGYLLCAQGDRMAMAQAIETRFPFLDHRLIAFASRLPSRYKLMGLTEKWLLKRSMDGLLPEALRHRSKQPYRTPDSQSFFHQGEPVDYVAELFSPARLKDAGYFDPQAAIRLFDKARAGKIIGFGDNMAFVGILSTQLLHEQFIRHAAA